MYHDHYGLDAAPFKITPDTHLFYQGATRGDILGALEYAILNGEGIIKVVGEVGSGKTMLCRMLEVKLPKNVEIVYLANPSLSPDDILHAIAFEMKLAVSQDANRLTVMHALQESLLEKHANNQQVVVFIEEAQRMPIDTLEEIRLLSNLETGQYKLLQMVMFGQPELDENLGSENIRQLKERITQSFYLAPFSKEDIGDYLHYRMQNVGYRGPLVFSTPAIKVISDVSQGLARRVNILADKALMAAFASNTHEVTLRHARQAVADSEFSDARRRNFSWFRPLATSALGLAAMTAAYLYLANNKPLGSLDIMANGAVNKITEVSRPGTLADQPAQALIQQKQVDNMGSAEPPSSPVEAEDQPAVASTHVRSEVAAESHSDSMARPVFITNKMQDSLTMARIAAANDWLVQAKPRHYSIQIMMLRDSEARRDLEKFLQRNDVQPYLDMMYVYRTSIKGQTMTGVVYGEYQNYRQAMKALNRLPDPMKRHGPHLRTVKGLRKDVQQINLDA